MAWIDTEGTFRGQRIIEIADRFNLDADAVCNNILVARTFTHEQAGPYMHQAFALPPV